MNCWFARRRLVKMGSQELINIENQALNRHLKECPACDHLRQLFISLNHDLVQGASLELVPHRSVEIKLPVNKKFVSSTRTSFWRKLDWWLAPELTLKWGFSVVSIVFLGVVAFNRFPENEIANGRLPNNLVIARGHIEITHEPEIGLHLLSGSVNTISIKGNNPDNPMTGSTIKGSI